ncbi:hypothetical protein [Streptomyces sp. NPDC002690]
MSAPFLGDRVRTLPCECRVVRGHKSYAGARIARNTTAGTRRAIVTRS